MTKQEAISECMKHWEFMAETGTGDKREYTLVQNAQNGCFFCEYTGLNPMNCVKLCPGWCYWANSISDPKQGHCMNGASKYSQDVQTSLYVFWMHSKTPEERKLWASRIVWMIWLIQRDIENKDHSDCVQYEFCYADKNCQGDSTLLEEQFCFDCEEYSRK